MPSDRLPTGFPVEAFTDEELTTLVRAYLVLLKVGDATQVNDEWHPLIDAAHQKLGVIFALCAMGGRRVQFYPPRPARPARGLRRLMRR